ALRHCAIVHIHFNPHPEVLTSQYLQFPWNRNLVGCAGWFDGCQERFAVWKQSEIGDCAVRLAKQSPYTFRVEVELGDAGGYVVILAVLEKSDGRSVRRDSRARNVAIRRGSPGLPRFSAIPCFQDRNRGAALPPKWRFVRIHPDGLALALRAGDRSGNDAVLSQKGDAIVNGLFRICGRGVGGSHLGPGLAAVGRPEDGLREPDCKAARRIEKIHADYPLFQAFQLPPGAAPFIGSPD